jgi:hypothetical protein
MTYARQLMKELELETAKLAKLRSTYRDDSVPVITQNKLITQLFRQLNTFRSSTRKTASTGSVVRIQGN